MKDITKEAHDEAEQLMRNLEKALHLRRMTTRQALILAMSGGAAMKQAMLSDEAERVCQVCHEVADPAGLLVDALRNANLNADHALGMVCEPCHDALCHLSHNPKALLRIVALIGANRT